MKPVHNLLLIGLMLFCVLGCKETDRASSPESIYFESNAVLKAVEDLSSDAFEGRRYDTEGSRMARDLIIEGFKRHGIDPFPQGYTQPFTVEIDSSSLTATNVIGYVEGTLKPDAYIVISAHYDHEGIRDGVVYNGADDNASGVGGLLAFADYFTDNPPKHSVILAAFDAEEDGLLGAYHFVDYPPVKLEQIKANINMDMISRSDTYTMWVLGPRYYPEFRPLVTAIDSTATHKARIGHEGLDEGVNWTYSSDHAAFYKKDIPFLFFTVDDHEDYHKPEDDFESIDKTFYLQSIEAIISVFQEMDTMNFTDPVQ